MCMCMLLILDPQQPEMFDSIYAETFHYLCRDHLPQSATLRNRMIGPLQNQFDSAVTICQILQVDSNLSR